MPRTNYLAPEGARRITDELRSLYGGTLSIADISEYLGLKNRQSVKAWLQGVKGATVNGRPRYYASDVARKLYEERL